MKNAVKVPLQKFSVSQIVTRQNAVILTPIAFAVYGSLMAVFVRISNQITVLIYPID